MLRYIFSRTHITETFVLMLDNEAKTEHMLYLTMMVILPQNIGEREREMKIFANNF